MEIEIVVKYNPFTKDISVENKTEHIGRMEVIGILAAAQQMIGFNWMTEK